MYVDLAIVVILLILVVIFFRKFSSFVYAMAIIDIFLRILNFIKNNVAVPELKALIGRYFPSSIPSIIGKYSSGLFYTLLMWAFVIIYIVFLFYIVRIFINKKK